MSYMDDLNELERQRTADLELMRRIRKASAPEAAKVDKLREYRDQRMNGPDGMVRLEPEFV